MESNVKKKVVVIGAVNMDIGGSPASAIVMRDSNPGTVTMKPGGVGRNIAHNLCNLGLDVSLVAAVGGDVYGSAIMESCNALGMDMSMAALMPERRSSTYLYINDEKGDMQLAISDMDIAFCVDPDHLEKHMEQINKADAVVLDANLSPESIAYVVANCKVPVYADPVSTIKAMRLKDHLSGIYALKPNLIEAQQLTGEDDAEKAAAALLKMGVKRVFISMGEGGVLAADENEMLHLPRTQANVINTTGAGDAAAAAIVYAGVMGASLRQCAELSLKAGALTTECVEANNPNLAQILKD